MRQILQEGMVEERVQYIIEGLFKTARDGFQKSGHPQIPEGLDLLEDDDKVTVNFDITTDVPDIQMGLNIFKADPDFEEHEKEYEVRSKFCTIPSAHSFLEIMSLQEPSNCT